MIGSAPAPLRRDDNASHDAVVLPFRLRANRAEPVDPDSAAAPVVRIADRPLAKGKKNKAKATAVSSADRPTVAHSVLRSRLRQAVIAALLLHLAGFALLHFQFVNDVERAANAGGTVTSDGTMVIDVDVVADSKLPAAKTPTNMTSPDAKTQTNTPPLEKQEEKQKEAQKAQTAPNNAPQFALPKEELAAPNNKADTAPLAQSPNQEKRDDPAAEVKQVQKQKITEQKKKQEQAAPSTAASPNRAAANRSNQNQGGANGFNQNGGQADTSSYSAIVLAHLQRFRVYPDQARSAGVTGVSTVRFTLGAGGNVIAVSLAGSSGAGMLDQAALAMVQRAAPFPAIPPSLGRSSMTFAAPIRFNLR